MTYAKEVRMPHSSHFVTFSTRLSREYLISLCHKKHKHRPGRAFASQIIHDFCLRRLIGCLLLSEYLMQTWENPFPYELEDQSFLQISRVKVGTQKISLIVQKGFHTIEGEILLYN